MSMSKGTDVPLTVGFLPWWPQNPYQVLLKRELNALGVRVIGNPPLSLTRLLAGRDGLDIVHVHWPHGTYKSTWQLFHTLLILLAYRLLKNNIVWTVHELTAYESRHPLRDAWFRWFVMQVSRHLIVHGEYTKRVLHTEKGFRRSVSVAYHPSYKGWYKDEVTREQARMALRLPLSELVFLYFGYIKPYKGVEDLILAFRKISESEGSLYVVGRPLDATIQGKIEALVATDPRVRTRLDYIADDEIQIYFRAADVVVFPFRETQTSGSLMLALTFDRPIVAPAIATLSEYVDDSMAVLYNPTSADALENALNTAAKAPLEQMARCAKRRAAELDWGRMAAVHLAAYRDMLPRHHSVRAEHTDASP